MAITTPSTGTHKDVPQPAVGSLTQSNGFINLCSLTLDTCDAF